MTDPRVLSRPFAMTVLGGGFNNLSGMATGNSAREILLNIARMATEEQAQAILARIGTVSRAF